MLDLVSLEQRLDSELSFSAVADTAAGAVAFLARSGSVLRLLSSANVFYRVLLGRQLQLIQERHLWDRVERSSGDEQNPPAGPYHSWDDFMTHGFPQITGLSPRTGYAATMLANAPALRNLPEPELRKFENLGNAFELMRLERRGVRVTEELLAAAQTLSVEQFRQKTGSGKKATVAVIVDGSATARVLQSIVDILKRADPDSLLAFQEVLQNAMLQAGGNVTDGVDCINVACIHQWQQEGIAELAKCGVSSRSRPVLPDLRSLSSR